MINLIKQLTWSDPSASKSGNILLFQCFQFAICNLQFEITFLGILCTQLEAPEPRSDQQGCEPLSRCARWQSELHFAGVRRSLRRQPYEALLQLCMPKGKVSFSFSSFILPITLSPPYFPSFFISSQSGSFRIERRYAIRNEIHIHKF